MMLFLFNVQLRNKYDDDDCKNFARPAALPETCAVSSSSGDFNLVSSYWVGIGSVQYGEGQLK